MIEYIIVLSVFATLLWQLLANFRRQNEIDTMKSIIDAKDRQLEQQQQFIDDLYGRP